MFQIKNKDTNIVIWAYSTRNTVDMIDGADVKNDDNIWNEVLQFLTYEVSSQKWTWVNSIDFVPVVPELFQFA